MAKKKSPPRLSAAGKTRNPKFGFYGTIKGNEKERLTKYTSIFNSIKRKFAKDDNKRDINTRNFLDSSHGRHIANHMNDGTSKEEIANQVKGRFKRFMKNYDPKLFGESTEEVILENTKQHYYNMGHSAFTSGKKVPEHFNDERRDLWMQGNKDAALGKPYNPPKGKLPLSDEQLAKKREKSQARIIAKYGSLEPKDKEPIKENIDSEEDDLLLEWGGYSEEAQRVMKSFIEGKEHYSSKRSAERWNVRQDHSTGDEYYHIGSKLGEKGLGGKIYGIIPENWNTRQTRQRLGMLHGIARGINPRWAEQPQYNSKTGKTTFKGKEIHEGIPFLLHDPNEIKEENLDIEETPMNNKDERISQMIGHAFDGEVTRVSSLLDEIMKDRLASLVDQKKAEIAERLFGNEESVTEFEEPEFEELSNEETDEIPVDSDYEDEEEIQEKSLGKQIVRAVKTKIPGTTEHTVANKKANLIKNNEVNQPTGFKTNNDKLDYATAKSL